ncbi:hypothetical protein [Janthinobacterium sp. AD80]|uniref:hypothetical protein n=1 Tax=Janthinobacterium sp. AD80 TaxID=1528773 RepID=UPI0011AF0DB3|nr:hypothetical protein [Janthinobacterium sp. AD80]
MVLLLALVFVLAMLAVLLAESAKTAGAAAAHSVNSNARQQRRTAALPIPLPGRQPPGTSRIIRHAHAHFRLSPCFTIALTDQPPTLTKT